MTYTITEACIDVTDKSCVDECPVDCIYEGNRMLYIQPDECIDCGACVPVCPVDAIIAEENQIFTPINAEYFEVTGLGSPGGANQVGSSGKDHPIVVDWKKE